MEDLSDLTASPVALKIGGANYEVSPFGLQDLGSLANFVKFQPYRELLDVSATTPIPADVIRETLQKCIDQIISDEHLDAIHRSFAGLVYAAYLSLKHKHPTITQEVIGNWPPIELGTVCDMAFTLTRIKSDENPVEFKKKLLETKAKLKEKGILIG